MLVGGDGSTSQSGTANTGSQDLFGVAVKTFFWTVQLILYAVL
jgi:hypothetical protein